MTKQQDNEIMERKAHTLTASLVHLNILNKVKEEDFSEIRFKYHNKEKDCYEEVYLYPDKLPYGICKHLIATIKNKIEKLLNNFN